MQIPSICLRIWLYFTLKNHKVNIIYGLRYCLFFDISKLFTSKTSFASSFHHLEFIELVSCAFA